MGVAFSVQSQSADSIRFSLLTCAPGTEIYSLFGHTAIRYENYTRRIDVVFNYGMFSWALLLILILKQNMQCVGLLSTSKC